jgi:hypothetical protein
MFNSKISALTSATTPLAGTETLPIVQSSTTKQVSVANLTAGRAVSMLSGTAGTSPGAVTAPVNADDLVVQNTAAAGITILSPDANAGRIHFGTVSNNSNVTLYGQYNYGFDLYLSGSIVLHADTTTKDLTCSLGNLVQGTAAKGVNFTANTPAAGMTSQLLNWYEEGAYTPTAGGFVVVLGGGTVTYAGKYTRVGRLVKVTITITTTGAATVAAAGGATCYLSLPFAPSTIDSGTWANTSTFATSGVVTVNTNQNMFVVNSWTAANSSWTLQASYNV